jgi:hypothetical protein
LLGATNEDLADLFEVSLATVGNWLRRYPAFKKAVQGGRDVADAEVAHSLHRQTLGFTHPDVKILVIEGEAQKIPYDRYFPPDRQAAIHWLRNRRRKQWREVIEHEHTISDEKLRELEAAPGGRRIKISISDKDRHWTWRRSRACCRPTASRTAAPSSNSSGPSTKLISRACRQRSAISCARYC